MDSGLIRQAEIMWDYMQLYQPPEKADCMIILGSRDDRVAKTAAGLSRQFAFGTIVISGGLSHTQDLLKTSWGAVSEADHFNEVFIHADGAATPLLERCAQNTGQNALYTHKLLLENQIRPKSICIVTKPYMERRALATFAVQWPERNVAWNVQSAGGTLAEYCNDEQPMDVVINIMVGDLQRIIEYPKRGLQMPQDIPDDVIKAFESLISKGFTRHLVDT